MKNSQKIEPQKDPSKENSPGKFPKGIIQEKLTRRSSHRRIRPKK